MMKLIKHKVKFIEGQDGEWAFADVFEDNVIYLPEQIEHSKYIGRTVGGYDCLLLSNGQVAVVYQREDIG